MTCTAEQAFDETEGLTVARPEVHDLGTYFTTM